MSLLGLLGELLITLGVLVLAFVVWQVWWTDVEADTGQAETVTATERAFAAPAARARLPRGVVAIVRIPRIGQARPLVAGTGYDELRRGIGHDPASASPGAVGNVVTAGHRVTYGRPYHDIAELRAGDAVVLETARGWAVYRYVRHRIVTPDHVEVTAPVPDRPGARPTEAWLTMIACHPKFSARERYVGYALLDRVVARADGPPPEIEGMR